MTINSSGCQTLQCSSEAYSGKTSMERPRFSGWLLHWARRVRRMNQLYRERSQLHELSDEQLRDIGLTRHEANRESRRHYWDDIGWRR